MVRILPILVLVLVSCTPIHKVTYKAEEAHYALYKQKALLVYDVKYNKVLLANLTTTRCYYLRGKQYVQKWHTGDTMVIDNNLTDFYSLKFARKCE
jgi:hypothetical protein